jgi:hypothetical protein
MKLKKKSDYNRGALQADPKNTKDDLGMTLGLGTT